MDEKRRESLVKAGVDIEDALDRFMGDDNMLVEFLKQFDQDPNFECYRKAMKEQQYDEAFKALHSVKGLCGNLSLMRLFEVISPEVEFLRTKQHKEAQEKFAAVVNEYERTLRDLQEIE